MSPSTPPISLAHQRSNGHIIDPCYDSTAPAPAVSPAVPTRQWLYGPAELECWRLGVLRQRMTEARLKVGYPGKFHSPATVAWFRRLAPGSSIEQQLVFEANGAVELYDNGEKLYSSDHKTDTHATNIKFGHVLIKIDAGEAELPTLHVSDETHGWEFSSDQEQWVPCQAFAQSSLAPYPHHDELMVHHLEPEGETQGCIDFGRELYGHIVVRGTEAPNLYVGESVAECLNTDESHFEQYPDLELVETGIWRTRDALAFRYVKTTGPAVASIACESLVRPVQYRGAFACSDERLNAIWMYSAYTLRLCMVDFLLDGVKRDRLPWTGDMAISLMANAFSFHDSEITRRSLVALGRAGIEETDINGIVDYSMWWVISQDLYLLYFDDRAHLAREWSRITSCLEILMSRCNDDGVLIPDEGMWTFIDWVEEERLTALQQVWWWCLQSGIKLAQRKEDTALAEQLEKHAKRLSDYLCAHGWNDQEKYWEAHLFKSSTAARHANFTAVLSGFTQGDDASAIAKHLMGDRMPPVGTPYMKGLECLAVAKAGDVEAGLGMIRDYWGGMIDRGATTFWEAYDPSEVGDSAYAFYDRPYAKSLCHAWSAGPAAFLPDMLLGLEVLTDGCTQIRIEPSLAGLEWLSCCVPFVHGVYQIDVTSDDLSLTIPAGGLIEYRGQAYQGPWDGVLPRPAPNN